MTGLRCVGINDPIVRKRHPVTFPHASYRPISLQSRMCCAIVLWDEHRFHDDTAPCSFSKKHVTVPHVIVALLDQASFLAVEGMLDREPLPTAVATLGKGRWGVVLNFILFFKSTKVRGTIRKFVITLRRLRLRVTVCETNGSRSEALRSPVPVMGSGQPQAPQHHIPALLTSMGLRLTPYGRIFLPRDAHNGH